MAAKNHRLSWHCRFKFDEARCLFQHFWDSRVITAVHTHKSGVMFYIFPMSFKQKLRSCNKFARMTKSIKKFKKNSRRWSCLKWKIYLIKPSTGVLPNPTTSISVFFVLFSLKSHYNLCVVMYLVSFLPAIKCDSIQSFANGIITYSPQQTSSTPQVDWNVRATFSCGQDFTLEGDMTSTCGNPTEGGVAGVWSHKVHPKCNGKYWSLKKQRFSLVLCAGNFSKCKKTLSVEMEKGLFRQSRQAAIWFQADNLLLFLRFTFTFPFSVTSAFFSHPIK